MAALFLSAAIVVVGAMASLVLGDPREWVVAYLERGAICRLRTRRSRPALSRVTLWTRCSDARCMTGGGNL